MTEKRSVLFLCTGNSARSQMAEALVNQRLGDRWAAISAGTEPATAVHPLAVEVMAELGIDISHQEPKAVSRFEADHFDLVVTLCDDAARNCPIWFSGGKVRHISFPDPAQAVWTLEQRLQAFRLVRDSIREDVLNHLLQTNTLLAEENSDDTRHI